MKELKEYNKEDLKNFFGLNKKGIAFFDIWIKKYPILSNEDVFRWITTKMRKFANKSNKNPKDFNLTSYIRALQEYCDYNKVNNPSELLQENIDKRNKRVIDYLVYLINVKGLNEVSVKNAYQSRIKSFYSARGFPISDGLDTEQNGKNENEIDLNKDKLQAILTQINNSEYKIIAKIQALLGLRVGDVLKELTTTKEMRKKIKGEEVISEEAKYRIELYDQHYYIKDFETEKQKVKIRYLFFPKELSRLIQTTYPIYQKDLRELDLSKDFLRTQISEKKGGKMILASEYRRKLRKIAKELYPNENMKTHSLRKYFYTRLGYVNLSDLSKELINETMGSEVEEKFKEHLMGHKLNYNNIVYSKITNNKENFYKLWKALENSLCIDCELIDTTNKEVLELKEKNIKLEGQIATLLKSKIETNIKIDKMEEVLPKLLEAYKNMKTFISENLKDFTQKNVKYRNKIIDTLGLKETPEKTTKKLDIKSSKLDDIKY